MTASNNMGDESEGVGERDDGKFTAAAAAAAAAATEPLQQQERWQRRRSQCRDHLAKLIIPPPSFRRGILVVDHVRFLGMLVIMLCFTCVADASFRDVVGVTAVSSSLAMLTLTVLAHRMDDQHRASELLGRGFVLMTVTAAIFHMVLGMFFDAPLRLSLPVFKAALFFRLWLFLTASLLSHVPTRYRWMAAAVHITELSNSPNVNDELSKAEEIGSVVAVIVIAEILGAVFAHFQLRFWRQTNALQREQALSSPASSSSSSSSAAAAASTAASAAAGIVEAPLARAQENAQQATATTFFTPWPPPPPSPHHQKHQPQQQEAHTPRHRQRGFGPCTLSFADKVLESKYTEQAFRDSYAGFMRDLAVLAITGCGVSIAAPSYRPDFLRFVAPATVFQVALRPVLLRMDDQQRAREMLGRAFVATLVTIGLVQLVRCRVFGRAVRVSLPAFKALGVTRLWGFLTAALASVPARHRCLMAVVNIAYNGCLPVRTEEYTKAVEMGWVISSMLVAELFGMAVDRVQRFVFLRKCAVQRELLLSSPPPAEADVSASPGSADAAAAVRGKGNAVQMTATSPPHSSPPPPPSSRHPPLGTGIGGGAVGRCDGRRRQLQGQHRQGREQPQHKQEKEKNERDRDRLHFWARTLSFADPAMEFEYIAQAFRDGYVGLTQALVVVIVTASFMCVVEASFRTRAGQIFVPSFLLLLALQVFLRRLKNQQRARVLLGRGLVAFVVLSGAIALVRYHAFGVAMHFRAPVFKAVILLRFWVFFYLHVACVPAQYLCTMVTGQFVQVLFLPPLTDEYSKGAEVIALAVAPVLVAAILGRAVEVLQRRVFLQRHTLQHDGLLSSSSAAAAPAASESSTSSSSLPGTAAAEAAAGAGAGSTAAEAAARQQGTAVQQAAGLAASFWPSPSLPPPPPPPPPPLPPSPPPSRQRRRRSSDAWWWWWWWWWWQRSEQQPPTGIAAAAAAAAAAGAAAAATATTTVSLSVCAQPPDALVHGGGYGERVYEAGLLLGVVLSLVQLSPHRV